ncbi:MAG: glycosyltransferase family 4 protein [Oscillochloris sp.]|nr:glycosyltransferase family 4 protein [Oscillochloris sp.]
MSTGPHDRPLRVCYFGTRRAGYARNAIIVDGLRRQGIEVIDCHESLWQSFADREQAAAGGWVRPAFFLRVLRTYIRLLWRYASIPHDYDVMVVGYPGQFDVILARVLTLLNGKPLVWDILMSIYLICMERGLHKQSPLTVALIHTAERLACKLPDRLILDTHTYVDWFCRTYHVDRKRFRLVPLTADERAFDPELTRQAQRDPAICRAVYHGTFIPNHGVPYIIEAARILRRRSDIQFELIGDGPQKVIAEQMVRDYGLGNVRFIGWLEKDLLAEHIAAADICLGTFGTTPQSLMTVQNKIYEALAMARPLITGDSPAVREALTPGEQLLVCDRDDPHTLAEQILRLRHDPAHAEALACRGRRHYEEFCGVDRVSARFADHLRELAGH